MEPILKGYFNKFKDSLDIKTDDPNQAKQQLLEASAFERFINYTLFSIDDPDVFVGNSDLFDFVCIGGGHDTGIDGIGIKINDRLIQSTDDIMQIIESSKKINVEFVFIQAKMRNKFDTSEFNTFGLGVKHFFSEAILPENDRVKEFRELKEFIYSDDRVITKLDKNPSLLLYYVTTGITPTDDHFLGTKKIIEKELKESEYYFDNVDIQTIDGKQILRFCKELENNFSTQLNTNDIIPLTVSSNSKIKKAYTFTCDAIEFLKILKKDDDQTLRRSLFNDNVRDYLGNKGNVNHEIEETIKKEPEMFLLCNNGITIVCSDFEQVRDKLVKIENPQIVNGCQTSNSIFNLRNTEEIKRVQVIIRLICTEDFDVSNKVVKSTNKQNQVLDEAFETTKPFHQDLEAFFNLITGEHKLYYERRIKQYSSNPLIKKYQIVNLRIITQVFVSMFLNSPHEAAYRHEAKLLEKYCTGERKIYNEKHDLHPYYLCALTWYMFEKHFRINKIEKKYKTYKAHLYLLFRFSVGVYPPPLIKGKGLTSYCEKLQSILQEQNFDTHVKKVVKTFDNITKIWTQKGNSIHAIKDRKDFTDLLISIARDRFLASVKENKETQKETWHIGEVLSIRIKSNKWFGFIKQCNDEENVYFDDRNYAGEFKTLIPHTRVKYIVKQKNNGKLYAEKVVLLT